MNYIEQYLPELVMPTLNNYIAFAKAHCREEEIRPVIEFVSALPRNAIESTIYVCGGERINQKRILYFDQDTQITVTTRKYEIRTGTHLTIKRTVPVGELKNDGNTTEKILSINFLSPDCNDPLSQAFSIINYKEYMPRATRFSWSFNIYGPNSKLNKTPGEFYFETLP